ncbi:MAG: hypothetical protein OYG31_02085 [Candidatus Kaiserbacteria bacterium]|nr:hypothetical protein [Candidatus Kaiserbacteria bacterium]
MSNHITNAIIFGVCIGIFATFAGMFIGLQVSSTIGTILIFPGGILISYLFDGFGNVPYGIFLVAALQSVWWTIVFLAINHLRGK